MACGAIPDRSLLLTPRSRSLLANRKRQAAFLGFLKNNTTSKPAWQEIVDFS
jgi:hypothetical protein